MLDLSNGKDNIGQVNSYKLCAALFYPLWAVSCNKGKKLVIITIIIIIIKWKKIKNPFVWCNEGSVKLNESCKKNIIEYLIHFFISSFYEWYEEFEQAS